MYYIFLAILGGLAIGTALKRVNFIFFISNILASISAYFLLFFLGMSTALKKDLFTNFKELGAESIILCLAGMLGSVLALIPLNKYLTKNKKILWSHLELKSNANPSEQVQQHNISVEDQSQSTAKEKNMTLEMILPLLSFLIGFFVTILWLGDKCTWSSFAADISLYLLVFFIGIGIGKINIIALIKRYHAFAILIPLTAMLGSMLMGLIIGLIINKIDIRQAITICSGMGYYSLSAMVCTQKFGEVVGVIALLSNLLRELLTMMFAPLLVKAFGNLAPIGTGGATAMDTTLPFIKKSAGAEYAIIGFISGVVLTVLVPIVGVLL
ncbi:MAG TPA: lysine exporter LysO family protein [Candidatus Cloacimonadota bacterium]|nr:lysine exporter LysO family protein [Candidatus Cloacimonadales bacterium]HPY95573.1 lysine exporter LysO family protein [Candidatus Cloacimonadota bacterium]HQB40141.1 lysine exporter LysO family protein [Candidatus Cloacimonadota bacterium]